MSNLNLQKLREWVWPWPWTFNLLCRKRCHISLQCFNYVVRRSALGLRNTVLQVFLLRSPETCLFSMYSMWQKSIHWMEFVFVHMIFSRPYV